MGATFNLLARANQDGKYLCVGLDPKRALVDQLPMFADHNGGIDDRLYAWARSIINRSGNHAGAFKANGASWARHPHVLTAVFTYIRTYFPQVAIIYDSKSGDVEHTAAMWAEFAVSLGAHAVTLSPYMGTLDITEPFLREGLDCFVLGSTSNPNAGQFQNLLVNGPTGHELLSTCVTRSVHDADNRALGIVAGAIESHALAVLSRTAPYSPFLIPGVGAQGGDLERVVKRMHDHRAPWVVNVGRDITDLSYKEGSRASWEQTVEESVLTYARRLRI